MSTFKELRKLMSKFLNDIEQAIANIHQTHGVDNATVVQEISKAVGEAVTPLNEQIAALQGQVADLQKAAQDTVAALQSGDTDGAKATASAAAGNSAIGAPAESEAANNGGEQAVS
jgi:tetrahydromethanopterin S-methyltransferase subunit B